MKKLVLIFVLGCGDNIHLPDAQEPEVTLPDVVAYPPDLGVCDAGVDAYVDPCIDKHLPKQEHKCQHDQGL